MSSALDAASGIFQHLHKGVESDWTVPESGIDHDSKIIPVSALFPIDRPLVIWDSFILWIADN